MRAFETPDDVGALLRVHFEMDRALDHVVNCLYLNAKALNLRYPGHRIEALSAIGVLDVRLQPVRIINRIRNSFAHKDGREELSADDVRALEQAISDLIPNRFHQNWSVHHISRSTGARREWVYHSMTIKQQFCTLAFLAIGAIADIISKPLHPSSPGTGQTSDT